MRKLSIDDLRKLREDEKRTIYPDGSSHRGRIFAHMGTCGVAAGAEQTLRTIRDGIAERGIQDIQIVTTGCAGYCSMEPMITVCLAGEAPVKYGCVDAKRARRILDEHLVERRVVAELAIGIGSESAG